MLSSRTPKRGRCPATSTCRTPIRYPPLFRLPRLRSGTQLSLFLPDPDNVIPHLNAGPVPTVEHRTGAATPKTTTSVHPSSHAPIHAIPNTTSVIPNTLSAIPHPLSVIPSEAEGTETVTDTNREIHTHSANPQSRPPASALSSCRPLQISLSRGRGPG